MNESTLFKSVARATGESVRRVRRMGFVLVAPPSGREPQPAAQTQQPGQGARHVGAGAESMNRSA